MSGPTTGPLEGLRVVELAGIGPGPFAAMMLADMGAEVIRVERTQSSVRGGDARRAAWDVLNRSRRCIAVDLKHPDGVSVVLRLAEGADALIEGFRPGVAERLGVGPEVVLERNPALVYGRITGWGQEGPYAGSAGHDINYIALAGALDPIGPAGGRPVPPLNLVGDFGGGGMLLAYGVVCGVLESRRSGKGQVIDAAMVDGAALLMSMLHGLSAAGAWKDERGTNLLDGGAHFYDTYETADGKFVAFGAIEPQFYAELLRLTGADLGDSHQMDRGSWPAQKAKLAEVVRTKTQAQWCALLEGTDACFAPVLTMTGAPEHPHNRHRGTFVEVGGMVQPGPAPRFSRTPGAISRPPAIIGEHTDEVLGEYGFTSTEVESLRQAGAIA